jgi:hypothetical protein
MLQQFSKNHKSPNVFLIDVKVKGSNSCIHLLGPITLPQQEPKPPCLYVDLPMCMLIILVSPNIQQSFVNPNLACIKTYLVTR